ncbi:GFA family protein [Blastomonas sp. CACIA14H2]|uniref:GFA family protein n=1 Tax=Blastomonas sp. CACIA14H2 TaxID=1419876 RepID=UPI0004125AB6
MHTGSCLCGAITFTVSAPLKGPDACHCGQCRKQSGHYWASTDVKRSDLSITGEEHLRWYQSSPKVRRGFCDTCGSFLFWDPPHRDSMAVATGRIRCADRHPSARPYLHRRQGRLLRYRRRPAAGMSATNPPPQGEGDRAAQQRGGGVSTPMQG